MHFEHPYHIDNRGRTAESRDQDYVRSLIELVVFTAPGERVHRPTFGCGVMQLVFAPNSDTLTAAIEMTVRGALQQWLGELIETLSVVASREDALLRLEIRYAERRTQREQTAVFTRAL